MVSFLYDHWDRRCYESSDIWLAPLVMILAAVVVHRKRPRFLVMVLANALLLFAAIWATMNWLKIAAEFSI